MLYPLPPRALHLEYAARVAESLAARRMLEAGEYDVLPEPRRSVVRRLAVQLSAWRNLGRLRVERRREQTAGS